MPQRKWLMIVMLDACRRRLTPGIKATVSSIITGKIAALLFGGKCAHRLFCKRMKCIRKWQKELSSLLIRRGYK
jgi:hypothetical protein